MYKAPSDAYDRLIRAWTRSPYSQCELVLPDGRFVSSSPRDGGVRAKVINQDPAVRDFLPLPWIQAAHVEQLLEQEAGADYDWLGILGSQIRSRWFCSEFCAHVLDLE